MAKNPKQSSPKVTKEAPKTPSASKATKTFRCSRLLARSRIHCSSEWHEAIRTGEFVVLHPSLRRPDELILASTTTRTLDMVRLPNSLTEVGPEEIFRCSTMKLRHWNVVMHTR